ncbi:MAG: Protein TolB [Myxococcales bacterium]|nr:Protein TolB [Myxococcales bacterium]
MVVPDAGPGPATEIGLLPGESLTPGSWLFLNDWSNPPDTVFALPAGDLGGARHVVMKANRVWSMGTNVDGSTIFFSSNDPDQQADFGITVGDSIQNTFSYDTASHAVALLAPAGTGWINVNDECQRPVNGQWVYVCRRYDFTDTDFKGWRIGRIRIATGAFEFLRADAPTGPWELAAQDIPGTSRILYEQRTRPPGTTYSLWTLDLVSHVDQMVLVNAGRPTLAPDGHRVAFHSTTDRFKLWMFDLATPAAPATNISPTDGAGDVAWSPDGQTIVYTVYDQPNNCDHLERVTWTGTAWSAPIRVRDCTITHEFITDIAWVTVANF